MGATGSRTGGGSPTRENTRSAFEGVTSAGVDEEGNPYITERAATTEDKYEFIPGDSANNALYFEQERNTAESWQDFLVSRWLKEVPAMAEAMGEDPLFYKGFVETQLNPMLGYVTDMWHSLNAGGLPGSTDLTQSPQGLETLFTMGMSYLAGRDQRLHNFWIGTKGKIGNYGGGGGGRGPRRPTADEIRAQFDIDQLSADARDIWRSQLLDEPRDARGMAKAYVEAIVASPDQKLDFQTFIEKQAEGTARYASLYRNKPKGMTAQQYLMPYLNSAQQVARPKDAVNIAAGGAQLGSDPNAFRSRLNRTNAATTSAPFISSMEQRMTGLKRVLKG